MTTEQIVEAIRTATNGTFVGLRGRKTLMGWMSVLLCVVWFVFLFYGMLHMAY